MELPPSSRAAFASHERPKAPPIGCDPATLSGWPDVVPGSRGGAIKVRPRADCGTNVERLADRFNSWTVGSIATVHDTEGEPND